MNEGMLKIIRFSWENNFAKATRVNNDMPAQNNSHQVQQELNWKIFSVAYDSPHPASCHIFTLFDTALHQETAHPQI